MPKSPSDDDARADDEARAFGEAMRGARPLDHGPRRVTGSPRPASARRVVEPPSDVAPLVIETVGDAVSGRASDVSAALLRALRRGEHRPEARLDLHGLTRDEALRAAEQLVQRSRGEGRRVMLVIHGRGHGSEGGEAVLRPALQAWLGTAAAARAGVMAFAPAPPRDGGTGATLILVRRESGRLFPND
jgi:DNA-nicking Smr family endonuclease